MVAPFGVMGGGCGQGTERRPTRGVEAAHLSFDDRRFLDDLVPLALGLVPADVRWISSAVRRVERYGTADLVPFARDRSLVGLRRSPTPTAHRHDGVSSEPTHRFETIVTW